MEKVPPSGIGKFPSSQIRRRVQNSNSKKTPAKQETKKARFSSPVGAPIAPVVQVSSMPEQLLENVQMTLSTIGYMPIKELREKLSSDPSTPLSDPEKKQLNEVLVFLRLTEYQGNSSELYPLQDAMENQGTKLIPLINTDLLFEFEQELKSKESNSFSFSTIQASTIDNWKRHAVTNILKYSRPDFLQEGHKPTKSEKRKYIDMHKAVHLRESMGEKGLEGADILDAKVQAFVTDAYSLQPVYARHTDIEHLQAFDQFKESVNRLFMFINTSSDVVKDVVLTNYVPKGLALTQTNEGGDTQIVPTEYVMRLLFNLYENTVLMEHYFNTLKGAQGTESVLQGAKEYGTSFASRVSELGTAQELTELTDRATLIKCFRSDNRVIETLRGDPLFKAIHAWVEKGEDIQMRMLVLADNVKSREYLYVLANRLRRNRGVPRKTRHSLRDLAIKTLDREIDSLEVSKLRKKLKTKIQEAYSELNTRPSPGARTALLDSVSRRRVLQRRLVPVQETRDGSIIDSKVTQRQPIFQSSSDSSAASRSERSSSAGSTGTYRVQNELIEMLQKQLGDSQEAFSKLEAHTQSQAKIIERLEAQNEHLEAQNEHLEVQNEHLEAQNERLEVRVSDLESEMNKK